MQASRTPLPCGLDRSVDEEGVLHQRSEEHTHIYTSCPAFYEAASPPYVGTFVYESLLGILSPMEEGFISKSTP